MKGSCGSHSVPQQPCFVSSPFQWLRHNIKGNWSSNGAQRRTSSVQVPQAGLCHQGLHSRIKMRFKKMMMRKPGHSHPNLGCEAAGWFTVQQLLQVPSLPTAPSRAISCPLLLPCPAGSIPWGIQVSCSVLCPRALALINCPQQGWKRRSGFLRGLLGTDGRYGTPSVGGEQSWAQRTADGAPRSSQDSRSHSWILKGRIFHVSEEHSAVEPNHFMDRTSCWWR